MKSMGNIIDSFLAYKIYTENKVGIKNENRTILDY